MGEEVYTMTMHNFSGQKSLFQKAHDLTQKISYLLGSGVEVSELFTQVDLVYSAVAVIDDEGIFLQLEKYTGNIKTKESEISEIEDIVHKYRQQQIVSAVLTEDSDIVKQLNARSYIFTDVNGQRYAIYMPGQATIFNYICNEKGELIGMRHEMEGEFADNTLLGVDGMMRTQVGEEVWPKEPADIPTLTYIRDFYEELTDWLEGILSRER